MTRHDDGDWEIVKDYEASSLGSCSHCKHSGAVREESRPAAGLDGKPVPNQWTERLWTIPRVVVAYTQGGYDCTIVCLDCIMEAAE